MNKKVNSLECNGCKICNKTYASKSSLCNHNKKFHNLITTNNNFLTTNNNLLTTNNNHDVNEPVNDQLSNVKKYSCRYCNKIYNIQQSRWKHEKICKNKKPEDKKLELLIKKEEAKILKLKIKLENSDKIDNITLKKLNKKLMERNNLIKNSTVNSHNTNIQNNTIINYNLIGFGRENITENLTLKDKKQIINARYHCLEKLVEIVHCGNYNQFKNIIITNIKDNYMYKFEENKGQFILSSKNEVMNSLVEYRMCDLEVIYNDLVSLNKIDNKTKDIIEDFINRINYIDKKHEDWNGKVHENYKQYKINEIKILLYNNQDKISNDISLFLSTNEV